MAHAPDDIIVPLSPVLRHVLEEARDISEGTGQPVTSAHVLLAFFVSRNPAERLLRSRGIDEDGLLDLHDPAAKEPRVALREVVAKGSQMAAGCGATEVDCLHVLVAMTRHRQSIAFRLLSAVEPKLGHLRTRALTILTGAVPRWMSKRARGDGTAEERASVGVSTPPRRAEKGRKPAISWTPRLVPPTPGHRRIHTPPHPRRRPEPGPSRPSLAKPSTVPPAAPSEPVARGRIETPPAPAPSTPKVHAEPQPRPPPPTPPAPSRPKNAIAPAPRATDQPPSDPTDGPPIDPAAPWVLDPESYPWLTSLGRNLSAAAARGELDTVVGRDREVETLIDILGKRRSNNPLLLGEPGVGKTAVVEGLALRLVRDDLHRLGRKILVALDVGALLVGTHLRGSFSEKMQGVKEEVRRSRGRVIVFFDEMHTLVGAGSTGDGPQDAANELKTALARGHFPCVGATTSREFKTHIEPDPALARRFVPVLIRELSSEQTLEMLEKVLPAYAQHHRVAYRPDALRAAVDLSVRYLTEQCLPDKALTLLDLAGSRAARKGQPRVDDRLVAELVAERVDLPVERLLGSDRERLLNLEQHLAAAVVGQGHALQRIAAVVQRNAAGFRGHRPAGSFLFVGPTGVGKTQTAKALAKLLHGRESALLRIDLSEFGESHSAARLIGAPPGYVGHDAGGQLTEAVRRQPGRVVLFDELEKAHPDVLQVLLQILDDGRLTDGHGRTVSFADCLVVMTSNLGADLHKAGRGIGFVSARPAADHDRRILEAARSALAPELWGRIDERIVFRPLTPTDVRRVARLLAADSSRRLNHERGITYELDDKAIDFLVVQGGHDLRLGARPMRQVLARLIEAPIAQRILEGRLRADERVRVSTRRDGSLIFVVEDGTSLSQRPAAR